MRRVELSPMETSQKKPRVRDSAMGFSGPSSPPGNSEKIFTKVASSSIINSSSVITITKLTTDPSYSPDAWNEVTLVPYECTNPDCRERKSFRR